MMKKVLFVDRDGTIIREPSDNQIDNFEKLEFLPGAISTLGKIAKEFDYHFVMVTNQDGLGTDSFPEDAFWPVQNLIIRILEQESVHFDDIFVDRSLPEDHQPTRKPGTAMLQKYIHGNYDLEHSYVIGDRTSDVQFAKNLGCGSILIGGEKDENADLTAAGWDEIYGFLKNRTGRASVSRKTKETSITIELNLYGTGKSAINTGIPFFDHMLEQIARHGNMDVTIQVDGDLQIDEHHTIEDTAITLGRAFDEALGSKKGIERYGFVIPMDDCLAQVAVDFGGRPWLEWQANFQREKIGGMPTEMFMHFFKSFSDYAKCSLNIKAEGTNEHHKIEAIFKAFARAAKMAVQRTGSNSIPSTKGSL
jgi:imidazoleglycerol-phosphate dehydratase/histidinol-phosphatase